MVQSPNKCITSSQEFDSVYKPSDIWEGESDDDHGENSRIDLGVRDHTGGEEEESIDRMRSSL